MSSADIERAPERLSNRAKWLLLGAFTVALLLLIAVIGEVWIRLRQSARYGTSATVEQLYTVDPLINLRVPIAGLQAGRIQINSLGFGGPEITQPKPRGTVRLAFLGASTTWCGEVSGNDMVWPALVTRRTQAEFPAARIDFVNGGVPGYTVASSLKNLQHRVAPLNPDVIIIYHATNDMSGELRELAAASGIVQDSGVQQPSWLSSYSLLWNLAEKNLRVLVAQQKAQARIGRLEFDPERLGEPFRRDLTALVRAAQAQAPLVVLATFSTQLRPGQPAERQLQAAASALYYMPFMTPESLMRGYRRYNEVILQVARDTGALVIERDQDIPGDPAHFVDTVHFSDAGSRAMADRVSQALLADPEFRRIAQAPTGAGIRAAEGR